MTELSSKTLIAAAERFLTEIGEHADNQDSLDLERVEHCARALCAQLKAVQELDAHNRRQAQLETGQTYTRYEDLPPLMPEDRDRLKQDLINLLTPRDT